MSKTTPVTTLLKSSIRSWIGAKGFWLVVVAALLPVALTGAWVGSHQADISASEPVISSESLFVGDVVNVTATITNLGKSAVGPFNVTLAAGPPIVNPGTFEVSPPRGTPQTIDSLAPGASRELNISWTVTGSFPMVYVHADPTASLTGNDEVAEIDEENNFHWRFLEVSYRAPNASSAPRAPAGLAGDENATNDLDLVVASLTSNATSYKSGQNVTFTAVVENRGSLDVPAANATLRVARTPSGFATTVLDNKTTLSIPPGGSTTMTLEWTAQEGGFWVEAWVTPPQDSRDLAPENNLQQTAFAVDPDVSSAPTQVKAPERATIKAFYTSILALLYVRVVLPLIALFYAAGVIADEKDRGALAYMLTRPIPRFLIPITKFVGSFLVATVAVIIGVVVTYALMFGVTNQAQDIGFLTTPLFASLVSLFVYGAAFTLLGTVVDRPYLLGLLFVLGWETVATVTGSVFDLASWVKNLTISQHIQNALGGWPLDEGVLWYPTGEGGLQALGVAGAIALVCLVLSAVWMHRREFHVG